MPRKRKSKSEKVKAFEVVFLVLFSFLTFPLFGFRTANAQVLSSTCSDPNYPEFNSLRPYPAEPCQTKISDTAKFCGNDLTLHLTAKGDYPGKGVCATNNDKITCTYNESVDITPLTIDLSDPNLPANLPFMGNTEDVPNSQPPTTTTPLTDKEKMSGYVSWYLNGVMNRAEDGSLKTVDPTTANYNVVNFSGPINKLLPSAILDARRVQTIANIYQGTNHNQTVVCAYGNRAVECYPPATGSTYYKLSDWIGNLSLWNSIFNTFTEFVNAVWNLFPGLPQDLIQTSLGDQWNSRIPPLPWSDENGEPFATEDLYRKAYNEWRGKTCILVPAINKVFCIDNFFVPNRWADLYPYIPLSSTEDLIGQITVDDPSSATSSTVNGVTVSGVTFSGQIPSTLFFPHMKEATELASILQDTFVAESEQGNKTANPTDVSTSSTCNPVEVRSNKGDKLFAKQLSGNLHYDVSFSCDFNPQTTTTNQICVQRCSSRELDPSVCIGRCQTTSPAQSCTKDIYISLSTTGAIPKANEIWSQTVAGPQSIFKRIFPKTNVAGGVGQIIDIPASTNITYSGSGISSSNTDLKFPHIGGVSEYFLKGIQTMLRPKGYGEPITFKPTVASNTTGDICGVASKYNIPCCMLKGIVEVETANNPIFIGTDPCTQNGQTFNCCIGNYCGTPRIACNQYADFNGNDNLNLCDPTDSAELLARAMLLKLCQADRNLGKISGICTSYNWATWGDYVLQNYTISEGDYTAAAYFYGLNGGCRTTSCSQFRWGAGKGYCDSVKSYCETGKALESKPDVRFCNQCNIDEMNDAGVSIDCSKY